jgi:hypothetical protein
MTLQSKPALLLALPGSITTLQLRTVTLLLAKHSSTAAATRLWPGLHCRGRLARLASTTLLAPAARDKKTYINVS